LALIVFYGFPVLLVREVWVRWNLGLPSLLLLGLAYGLLNEGIVAQTLTRPEGLPLPALDGYGVALGINWSWTLLLLPWHATHSMVFPVLLTDALFPREHARPWLRSRSLVISMAVILTVISALPIMGGGMRAALFAFGFALAMLALCAAAWRLRGYGRISLSRTVHPFVSVVTGMLFYFFSVFLPLAIAGLQLPFAVYALYGCVLCIAFVAMLRSVRHRSLGTLALVACGSYITMGLFRMGQGGAEPLVVGAVLTLALLGLTGVLIAQNRREGNA
jgi:hypothetical protein